MLSIWHNKLGNIGLIFCSAVNNCAKTTQHHKSKVNSGEHKVVTNTFWFKIQFIQLYKEHCLNNSSSDFARYNDNKETFKINPGKCPFSPVVDVVELTQCLRVWHLQCQPRLDRSLPPSSHPHPKQHFFGSKIKYNYKLLMKNYVKGSSIIY